MHISHTKYFNIPVSIAFATLAHTINEQVWDMSQSNKLSDIQYARFQILPVDSILGCFGQLVSHNV